MAPTPDEDTRCGKSCGAQVSGWSRRRSRRSARGPPEVTGLFSTTTRSWRGRGSSTSSSSASSSTSSSSFSSSSSSSLPLQLMVVVVENRPIRKSMPTLTLDPPHFGRFRKQGENARSTLQARLTSMSAPLCSRCFRHTCSQMAALLADEAESPALLVHIVRGALSNAVWSPSVRQSTADLESGQIRCFVGSSARGEPGGRVLGLPGAELGRDRGPPQLRAAGAGDAGPPPRPGAPPGRQRRPARRAPGRGRRRHRASRSVTARGQIHRNLQWHVGRPRGRHRARWRRGRRTASCPPFPPPLSS
ncbi:unnamed protein product, partial [Prorocentrum cordatum]